MTGLVVYRCHNCNWRGWAPERGQRRRTTDDGGPVVLRRSAVFRDDAFDKLEDNQQG